MADENILINGVASENNIQTLTAAAAAAGGGGEEERFYDADRTRETKMKQRIDALEHEKRFLTEQVMKLKVEIGSLKSDELDLKLRLEAMEGEIDRSEDSRGVLESVAARAAELETEVARLQHDLITAMSEGEEANAEIAALRRDLVEKEGKMNELKKEKNEMEKRVRELERKVGVLEVRETEEKSRKVRSEEEMRERIVEYVKRIEGLEMEARKKVVLEERLNESEEKATSMEGKMVELRKDMEEAEKVICGMKERAVETINCIKVGKRENGSQRWKVEWPVLALGSTVAVVGVSAIVYLRCSRQT